MKSSFDFAFKVNSGKPVTSPVRRRERKGERERVIGSKKGREDLPVDYPSTQQSMFQTREKSDGDRSKREFALVVVVFLYACACVCSVSIVSTVSSVSTVKTVSSVSIEMR